MTSRRPGLSVWGGMDYEIYQSIAKKSSARTIRVQNKTWTHVKRKVQKPILSVKYKFHIMGRGKLGLSFQLK